MITMKNATLACALVIASFLGGWLVGRMRPDAEAKSSDRAPAQVVNAPSTDVAVEAGIELAPSSRLSLAPESVAPVAPPTAPQVPPDMTMEEALAALDRAIMNQRIYGDDNAQFEAKYRGVSLDAAMEAKRLVEARMKKLQDEIFEQRMKDGRYEEFVHEPGEPTPSMRGSGVGLSTWSNRDVRMPDGSTRTRRVEFKAGEDPEFDSIRSEYWWLIQKTSGKLGPKLTTLPTAPNGNPH